MITPPAPPPESPGPTALSVESRLDLVAHVPLEGLLVGRTPLDLLSDVIDLGENVTVGWLSQSVVAHVLRSLGAWLTPTYFSWDLEVPSVPGGPSVRVEVKTCSTTQSWTDERREPRAWGCGRIASIWDPSQQRFAVVPPTRPAHVYVFVRRDGPVFAPSSYSALALTTPEVEAALPSIHSDRIPRSTLLRLRALRPLEELLDEFSAARARALVVIG